MRCFKISLHGEDTSRFMAARHRGYKLDVRGSVHHNINHTDITNKMQPCTRIYYSSVYQLLNMFRATHRSSSGAQKL
jgi:hypothetical protein